jgi:hypothetical protein
MVDLSHEFMERFHTYLESIYKHVVKKTSLNSPINSTVCEISDSSLL